jgi:hypothetical protein
VHERARVFVEIDEADFERAVFGEDAVVEEAFVGDPGAVFGRVSDDDRAALALAEVVEDTAYRIDVSGTKLIVDGDRIGFEEYGFLPF